MPQFDLDDSEVDEVMVFLKSRAADKVPLAYMVTQSDRVTSSAKGEQVTEYYNCKGCHLIDGDGGRIRDAYLEEELAK